MKINFRAENFEITPSIRSYAEEKVSKIAKYFDNTSNMNAHINAKVYKDGSKVEVTITMPGLVLRAEEKNNDLYAAFDLIADKLERQIRKHKTKINRKQRHILADVFPEPSYNTEPSIDVEQDEYAIKRRKSFELQPMDPEEAILQMNMLGHDFYLFVNIESGQTNVVYRRPNETYGLIETE